MSIILENIIILSGMYYFVLKVLMELVKVDTPKHPIIYWLYNNMVVSMVTIIENYVSILHTFSSASPVCLEYISRQI